VNAVRARTPGWAQSDALLPLLAAFVAFCAYYVWQAWRHETPAIFTDELELTQIARAIAHAGHPARRGEAYHFTSLYPFFAAPAWWIHSTQEAYDTVKYAGAIVMTAAIFPAYGIARTVLSQRWAVAAAIGAVAAPALSYSAIVVEEPLAYTLSTLALWLILRATLRTTWRSALLAFAAAIVATLERSQLVALVAVFAIALGAVGWRSQRMRAWRETWSRWDWIGAITLAIGAVIVLNAVASRRSQEWEIITRLYKERIWTYGTWAAGGLAVGLGILPLVAGFASIVPPRDERRDPARTAFSVVLAAALLSIGWYTAIKGAYISYSFESVIVERNLIYLDPLLFTGTALLIARRGTRWWWGLASAAFGLYLVAHLPYAPGLNSYPYYEAHGLAITAFANRIFHWPAGTIRDVAIVAAVVAGAVVLALRYLPTRGGWAATAVAVVCGTVLVWNVTAETYAANGEYALSHRFAVNFPVPRNWVDLATHGRSTTLLGQQFGGDSNRVWLTEFWNSSIKRVWSVDPAQPAPGPGPTLTPDLARPDGLLAQSPHTEYVLGFNGVTLQAPEVAKAPDGAAEVVYDVYGGPIKLASSQTGVAGDQWLVAKDATTPAFSAYNRFDAASAGPGFMFVRLGRIGYAGKDVPSHITVRLGTLVVGPDKQPAIGRVLRTKRLTIHSCVDPERLVCATAATFRNPGVPFRVEVTAFPTFVPHDFDPSSGERRHLAVQVSYNFVTGPA
jgi:hypothetical protein